MSKADEAVKLAKQFAQDNSHGYDQASRWGPDYDCSSLVITIWESVGVPVKSRGATYTGNMVLAFLQSGFEKVSDGSLLPGDVLVNVVHHTAIYIGNGRIIQASINENGRTTGGQTGDQNGKEICETNYYDYPWDYVLRYVESEDGVRSSETSVSTMNTELPILTKMLYNEVREDVKAFQTLYNLRFNARIEVDGIYGNDTETACKSVQSSNGLEVDGECGAKTWSVLIRGS